MGERLLKTIYKTHTLADIESECYKLYKKIRKDFVPDIIIGLARGGWIPARLFCDMFAHCGKAYFDKRKKRWKIPIIYPHLRNIGLRTYGGLASGRTIWYQPLNESVKKELRGKNVLIADDVLDTGKTLAEVLKHVKQAKPKKLSVAVIDVKAEPYSPTLKEKKQLAKIRKRADGVLEKNANKFYYCSKFAGNVWIIFPWEIKEDSLEIYKRFGKTNFIKNLPICKKIKKDFLQELRNIELKKVDEQKGKMS